MAMQSDMNVQRVKNIRKLFTQKINSMMRWSKSKAHIKNLCTTTKNCAQCSTPLLCEGTAQPEGKHNTFKNTNERCRRGTQGTWRKGTCVEYVLQNILRQKFTRNKTYRRLMAHAAAGPWRSTILFDFGKEGGCGRAAAACFVGNIVAAGRHGYGGVRGCDRGEHGFSRLTWANVDKLQMDGTLQGETRGRTKRESKRTKLGYKDKVQICPSFPNCRYSHPLLPPKWAKNTQKWQSQDGFITDLGSKMYQEYRTTQHRAQLLRVWKFLATVGVHMIEVPFLVLFWVLVSL